jgi:hypothetical protein
MKVRTRLIISVCFVLLLATKEIYSQNNTRLLKAVQIENPAYKEEFYVLKSDTSVKSGSYNKFAFPKQLITSGFYKNGKKDSTWIDYNRETNKPINKGIYSGGQKKGVWEYYYPNGELALKFDHSLSKTILCKNCNDSNAKKVLLQNDTSFFPQLVQREPFFNGDSKQLKVFLLKSVENDLKKLPQNQKKSIDFELIIDAEGKASKQRIINGLSQEIDYKILMQFKQIPDEWIPAVYQGKFITSKINFSFLLQ